MAKQKTSAGFQIAGIGMEWIIAFCLFSLLLPLLVVRVPPLVDYPNHIARYWLLAGGISTEPVSRMFEVDWNTLTNIGLDLLAVPLGKVLSFESVGRLFLACMVVILPLGAMLLNRRVFGGWHWSMLAAGMLTWNQVSLAGLLNFEIGLGLALVLASLESDGMPLSLRIIYRLGCAVVLVIMHVFAVVFYAGLLAALSIGPKLPAIRDMPGSILHAVVAALPCAAALGAIMFFAPELPGAHAHTTLTSVYLDFLQGFSEFFSIRKLFSALIGVISYNPMLDLLTWGLVGAGLVLVALKGNFRVHAGLALLACFVFVVFLIMPPSTAGTGWIDRRFSAMLPLIFVSGIRAELPVRYARYAAAVLVACALTRTASIAYTWSLFRKDLAEFERAIAPIQPGDKVVGFSHRVARHSLYPGRYLIASESMTWHVLALVLPYRHAFVPDIFAEPGKQPIRVSEAYSDLTSPEVPEVNVHAVDPAVMNRVFVPDYLKDWRQKFDYALIINADLPDRNGDFLPHGLELVKDEGFAALYRIRK